VPGLVHRQPRRRHRRRPRRPPLAHRARPAGRKVHVSVGTTDPADDIGVWIEVGPSNLTPEQAREVAHQLIEAADWAKDHQVSA